MISALDWFRRKALRGLWRIGAAVAPPRYLIPLRFRIHRWEDCEAELKYLDRVGPNRGVAVDAGANMGLFAYHMARWYDEVYAFEVNDELTQHLRAYGAENIHVINKGLSSTSGRATLHIPVVRGEAATGWATLDPDTYSTVETFRRKEVSVCRLDDYHLDDVGLIKIDVEGHEYDVIMGAQETIRRCRPHVIAEIKPQHVAAIGRFFAELGYTLTRAEQVIGVSSKANNYIFLPPSHRAVEEGR